MSTAQKILASNNVTLEAARGFIYSNVNNPSLIFNAAHAVGLTTDMLGEIAGVSGAMVRSYFTSAKLDNQLLDGAPTQSPNGISDYVFLTDLVDGDVFLYNPLTQQGKAIYSFGRSITDIAVDDGGNIYVSDFSNVYKYTVATGGLSKLLSYPGDFNSLAVKGDTLYAASSTNASLLAFNKDSGASVGATGLAGGASAGDITFIGNELFRTTLSNGLVEQIPGAAQGTIVTRATDANYWGLSATAGNQLRAFDAFGHVLEINPTTGQAAQLPDVKLVGLTQISGAAEAQTVHVNMFL